MLKSDNIGDGGHLTAWYPNVFAPKLILTADFFAVANEYHLYDYNGKSILKFRVMNNGERIDLQGGLQ